MESCTFGTYWNDTGMHIPWKLFQDAFEMTLEYPRYDCVPIWHMPDRDRENTPRLEEYPIKMFDLNFISTVLEMDDMGNRIIERIKRYCD